MTKLGKQGNSANNVKDIIETEKKNSEEDLANPKDKTEMVKQGNSANNVKDIIKTEKKNSEEDLANLKDKTEMVKQGNSANNTKRKGRILRKILHILKLQP